MKKKKVIFFDLAGPYFPGGCEKYFANLANTISQNSNCTVQIAQSRDYIKFMDYVYLLLTRRPIGSIKLVKREIGKSKILDVSWLTLVPFTQHSRFLKELLKSADVIYAKNEFQELLLLYLYLGKKLYFEKVIIGIHTPIFIPDNVKGLWKLLHDLQYNSILYKNLLKNSRLIHVNNKNYQTLINTTYKVKKNKIKLIHNPIDWKVGLAKGGKNKFTIIWIGRFTEQKGLDRLENITKVLSKNIEPNNIKLIIAGSGEFEHKVLELQKKYSFVHYLGYVDDVKSLYLESDLSLFTAYFDTFAHAVLEPLSYGVPVVSYDIPGPRDMIINDHNGYLVNSDKEAVTKIIELFSKNKKKNMYTQWQKKIFTDTNKKFSKTKIFKELSLLFK